MQERLQALVERFGLEGAAERLKVKTTTLKVALSTKGRPLISELRVARAERTIDEAR